MLKTFQDDEIGLTVAYHLGEGRMLKTQTKWLKSLSIAYHLGEGRMLKTTVE